MQGWDQHWPGAGVEPGQGAGGGEGEAEGDQGEGLGGLAEGSEDQGEGSGIGTKVKLFDLNTHKALQTEAECIILHPSLYMEREKEEEKKECNKVELFNIGKGN